MCLSSPQILKAMGLVRTASTAVNLLIDIGYFPVHVNLDLLKFNIPTDHSDEIISAAESLLLESSDPDEVSLLPGLQIILKYLCKNYIVEYSLCPKIDEVLSFLGCPKLYEN
jgi:hypothetical protein